MDVQGITYQDLILLIGDVVTVVQDLFIEEGMNNHGELQLIALIDEEDREALLYEDVEEFAIFYQKEDEVYSLFQGIIMESYIQSYGDIYLLKITAKTATCFMDVTRKKRIFQNPTVTSHELLQQIMMIYRGSKYLSFIPDEPISEPIVQYEETDWEFLKRFFSRYNVPILVDCNGVEQRFIAGISKAAAQIDWTDKSYEVLYQMDLLHHFEKNSDIPVGLKHGVSYQIRSYEVYSLGRCVKIDDREMYIGRIERTLEDGILTNQYTLYHEEGFVVPTYYNPKITGVSVNGNVVAVERNKVQVMTMIEGLISQNRYWFPFSTVAASNDGSGWYCMPEIGEQVRIHFPVSDEKEGYAITSIQGHLSEASSGGFMSNPDVKNISANNKNIYLTEDEIIFKVDDGNGGLRLSKAGEIALSANQSITVRAIENIEFHAEKQLLFSANGEINIKNDAGGDILIAEEHLDMNANKIHLNPPVEEEAEETTEE